MGLGAYGGVPEDENWRRRNWGYHDEKIENKYEEGRGEGDYRRKEGCSLDWRKR